MRSRSILTAVALAAAAALPAAGDAPAAATTSGGPCGWATTAAPATFDHVVWVVYENKSWQTVFGKGWAPYITGLAGQCGRGDNMNHLSRVSLANYVGLTSGSTGSDGEITSNDPPAVWPQSSVSLYEQLGTDWRQLDESMPSNCARTSSGYYTVDHSAPQYYTRIPTLCAAQTVPMGSPPDISAKLTVIIPNKVHDMHKTDVTTTIQQRVTAGDTWTSQVMPQLLASPEYQAGNTVIILTWDEANAKTSRIPFVVVSPYTAPGTVSTTYFTHYSLLKATEEMLGIPTFLGHANDAGTTSVRADFNLG